MRRKRDLTEAQFLYRAAKLGWKINSFGTHMKHERHPNASIGVVFDAKTFRILGRATLAHLAKQLRKMDAEKSKLEANQ